MSAGASVRSIVRRLPWEATWGIIILVLAVMLSMVWTLAFPGSWESNIEKPNRPPSLWSSSGDARDVSESSSSSIDGPDPGRESALAGSSNSAEHWYELIFGSQTDGIDTFAYMVSTTKHYVVPALLLVTVVLVVGSGFGVFSGYYENSWISAVADFSSNAISVYPPLLLLILVVYLLRAPSLVTLGIVYGVTEATRLGSLIRNKIAVLKKEDFVAAAQEMGMSDRRIILRHILWYNCRELLVIQSVFSMSSFIMMELYLGYLNKADSFDAWGKLIGPLTSRGNMETNSWYILPSLIVIIVVGALYLLGDGLIRYFGSEKSA